MATRTVTKKVSSRSDQVQDSRDYIVPVIHTHVPESLVNLGFFGALGAVALAGAVELPVAFLVGAGAAIARHRHG
ncbi:MAG: hypothetical protein ACYCSF_04850 [Acidimicrobiales bacterium]